MAAVDARWGTPCAACEVALIGHEIVLSLVLGLGEKARCGGCLASGLGLDTAEFLTRGMENVRRLECYRAGWLHADRRLAREATWPEERMPSGLRLDLVEEDELAANELEAVPLDLSSPAPDAVYDAGGMACGELVLELRRRILSLPPGATLRVLATDASAPQDLPAWCRLTGHALVHAAPPAFLIRRRND